jgi:hypothetical protein
MRTEERKLPGRLGTEEKRGGGKSYTHSQTAALGFIEGEHKGVGAAWVENGGGRACNGQPSGEGRAVAAQGIDPENGMCTVNGHPVGQESSDL